MGIGNRKRTVKIAATICLVLITISFSLYFLVFDSEKARAKSDNPIANVTTPKETKPKNTLPALPQPENSPDDEYADVPVVEIGSIEIPKIDLNHKLYEGVWLTVLNVGPGHWPGTAEAGEYGNTVIAGHRVTHSKPFRNLDKLVEGDEIIVNTSTGSHKYRVTGSDIVYPEDIWIVDQTPGFKITLFACHPPGSARQRYVVYGELIDQPFEIPTNL